MVFKVSKSGEHILLLLNQLNQVAKYRIQTNASTDMAKQKVLHHLWAINTKHVRKINQIRQDIEGNQRKQSNDVLEKQREIERYEFEKQRSIHKISMDLNRLM